jgi:hypothetical protein
MRLLQDFLDQSKQLNQTPKLEKYPTYQLVNKKYKIIHQGLILPDLAAPLHYLNFFSLIGQPNIPILANRNAVQTTSLDTATVICSSSPHMVGQFNHYSIKKDCHFQHNIFDFSNREVFTGCFPDFQFHRYDEELSIHLRIRTLPLITYFTKLSFSLAEYWSLACECEGEVSYKGKRYQIKGFGSFEYARSFNLPYLPVCFFCYQIIHISQNRQILMTHMRDRFNRIIQSRIYVRDLKNMQSQMYDQNVRFKVHRVYPLIKMPNGQSVYLPRELEWNYSDKVGNSINLQVRSRGDFKFGVGVGYVGSFSYQISINGQVETGESGYCEYIDCRNLAYQEQDKAEKLLNELADSVPIIAKTG